MCGFSPGNLKLKLRGSRQTGHSASSSVASWLETTGRGAATIAAYGWRTRASAAVVDGGLREDDAE